MKQVLMTVAAVITLTACSNNETECCTTDTHAVKMMGLDSTPVKYLPDSIAMNNMLHGDSLVQLDTSVTQLNTDSIANVSDLLDTLAAYEPKIDTVQ